MKIIQKFCILSLLVLLAGVCYANQIVVTNKNDSGAGSLRSAVASAAVGDTIRFNPTLISAGSGTINLLTDIQVSNNIVIKGLYNASDTLYISGQNTTRLLTFYANLVKLDSLTLINGRAASGGNYNNGGALYFSSFTATVEIKHSVIRNCYAQSKGGAILFTGGDLSVSDCNIQGNTAVSDGGAIYFQIGGNLFVSHSVFNGNTSGNNGGAVCFNGGSTSYCEVIGSGFAGNGATQEGGAIYHYGRNFIMDSTRIYNNTSGGLRKGIVYLSVGATIDATISNSEIGNNTGIGLVSNLVSGVSVNLQSRLYLVRSTIHNNSDGGIYSYLQATNANASGLVNVSYSTISDNGNLSGNCGGIYSAASSPFGNYSYSSNVTVVNSTIVNNKASMAGSGIFSVGKLAATSYLGLKSSIVANNSGVNLYSFATTSGISSQGNNIFSNTSVLGSVASDQLGVTAAALNLGVLANNGGFTKTMRPGNGSPAINLGNISDMTNAQNGPVNGGRRDIGSTEWTQCIKQNSITATICQGQTYN